MKKYLSLMVFALVSMFCFGISNVSAQTLDLNYGEFYTDGTSASLGTAKVTMPDEYTLKTQGTSGATVTLDYWYVADGGTVLAGYDTGLYLTAFIPTNEAPEEAFDATITLAIPSKFNQTDMKIYNNGEEVKITYNSDGTISFVASIEPRFHIFNGTIFLKNNNSLTTTSDSKVQTSINAEKALPENSSLSVKEVEVSSELKTSEKYLRKVFDISVLDISGTVIEVKDNKMIITMNLDDDLKGFNTYKVVYIKDGKIAERLDATVTDGKLTFTTDHLSEYGIVAYNSEDVLNPQTLDNVTWYILFGSISLIVLIGASVYLKKRMN